MRKSSLILLLAMAFVLTTVVSGFCVVNEIGEPCVACDAGKTLGWDYGLQIRMDKCDTTIQGEYCPCPTFDYELGSSAAAAYGASNYNYPGYCPGQDVKGVIFKLCDCEKIDEMSTASNYAIRLTIMEPASGVYWTNQNVPRADLDCYPSTPSATCTEQQSIGFVHVSSHVDPTIASPTANFCLDPCNATGVEQYSLPYYSLSPTQSLYDPASASATEDCCFTCGTERVKAIQTCYGSIMTDLHSVLIIDSPTLVYDPNDINVQIGAQVKVKVEIVEEPMAGTICGGACLSICDCLVLFGEFTDCSPQGCMLCLPYLPAANSGWWAGMAFTNNCTKASLIELNFFAAGTTASYTFTVAGKTVDTVILSDIIGSLPGLATNAPIYVNVASQSASFTLEGPCGISAYVMMGNGTEAQGYVAPYGPCGCGSVGNFVTNGYGIYIN